MRSQNIDQGWQFHYGIVSGFPDPSGQENIREINLPHDYMIESDVTQTAPAGNASGFYTAGVASYTKYIDIPQEWENEKISLRFDGVMMNATVEANGCKVCLQHN